MLHHLLAVHTCTYIYTQGRNAATHTYILYMLQVRGVNAQYDARGNWTDAVLILPGGLSYVKYIYSSLLHVILCTATHHVTHCSGSSQLMNRPIQHHQMDRPTQHQTVCSSLSSLCCYLLVSFLWCHCVQ